MVFRSDHLGSDTYAGIEAAWSMQTIMMTECPKCPAGTYTNVSGSSSCTLCPEGSFQNVTGATASHACVACPPKCNSARTREICLCDSGPPTQVADNYVTVLANGYVTLYAAGDTGCVACDCGEKEERTYCRGFCEERQREAERQAKTIRGYTIIFVAVSLVCEMFAVLMINLLLFLQKQKLATAIYLFGLGTLLSGPGLKAHAITLSP